MIFSVLVDVFISKSVYTKNVESVSFWITIWITFIQADIEFI